MRQATVVCSQELYTMCFRNFKLRARGTKTLRIAICLGEPEKIGAGVSKQTHQAILVATAVGH